MWRKSNIYLNLQTFQSSLMSVFLVVSVRVPPSNKIKSLVILVGENQTNVLAGIGVFVDKNAASVIHGVIALIGSNKCRRYRR